jgi:hypothetical protein
MKEVDFSCPFSVDGHVEILELHSGISRIATSSGILEETDSG